MEPDLLIIFWKEPLLRNLHLNGTERPLYLVAEKFVPQIGVPYNTKQLIIIFVVHIFFDFNAGKPRNPFIKIIAALRHFSV